jgi:transcriptional regulator with XRE-family HTH domain
MRSDPSQSIDPLPKGRSLIPKQDFAILVEATKHNHKHQHAHKRILSGQNVFQVWREHFGENIYDVAEFMNVSDAYYVEIEQGEIEPDKEDIIAFCRYFALHPYDLTRENSVMSHALIEALLEVYDKPYLIAANTLRAKDLAYQLLLDELGASSRQDLERQYINLSNKYLHSQGLTIAIIKKAIQSDGTLDVSVLDIFDQVYSILEAAEDRLQSVRRDYNYYDDDWRKHSREYHTFGIYLYHDDRGWIGEKLFKDMRQRDPYDVMNDYLNDPSYIGLKGFPELTAPIFLNGRTYSWRQAQQEHAKYAELTFLASRERNKCKAELDRLSIQYDMFTEWVEYNADILTQYDTRQRILKHSDFKKYANPYQDSKPSNQKELGVYSLNMFW